MSEVLKKFTVLPPAPDACQVCATKHDPQFPHNKGSLYYNFIFNDAYGRSPTWSDAMEHCTEEMKQVWIRELRKKGVEL